MCIWWADWTYLSIYAEDIREFYLHSRSNSWSISGVWSFYFKYLAQMTFKYFYQKFWTHAKPNLIKFAQDAHEGNQDMESMSKSSIVMLIEVINLKSLHEFWPINFCNIANKIHT